jgi:hypothetical protein
MEPDLLSESTLNQEVGWRRWSKEIPANRCTALTINEVAIKLKPGIIQHEIDPTTPRCLESFDRIPQLWQVVSEDVLLRRCKVVATSGLEALDLLFGHVDEQRKVGRIAPEADL